MIAGVVGDIHGGATADATRRSAYGLRGAGQRRRLLAAILELAADNGHMAVTVGQVIARAGVSRATFYEQFPDRDRCFTAALAPHAARLQREIEHAVARQPPELAPMQALAAMLAFADADPLPARLLLADTLTGSRRVRALRERTLGAAAATVEQAAAHAAGDALMPDLPPALILGAGARRLASPGAQGSALTHQLQRWLSGYQQPLDRHAWSGLAELPAPASPFLAPVALRAPAALPAGRPRPSAAALAENQFMRIVSATAEVVLRDGYAPASVAAIARAAGVEPRVFYTRFEGKRQALAAAVELIFRHVVALTAGAYVGGETWPRRVWEAARALTHAAEQSPTLAALALLELQTAVPAAPGRAEQQLRAFTVFLQEGARDGATDGEERPPTCAPEFDAIAAAAIELGYGHALRHRADGLAALHPQLTFIALAPLMGPAAAAEFLHEQAASAVLPRAA